jgi:phenylalanyl-tRNA synthetase beta chain
MRLNLDWLRDFIDLPTSDPEVLAGVLDGLGHEVEEWKPIQHRFRGVVIGRVVDVAPHPDADRVRVTKVDIGDGAPAEIVCGAWNFEAGAVVPVAVPGAVLQGDFEIGRRAIRGVTSNGMICSERELELGDDGDGIMVLDASYPNAADMVGSEMLALLPANDAAFDLNITPNRPDAMSVYGIATDLAAYYGFSVREPSITVTEVGETSHVTVTITDEVACPRFAAREVRGITIGASPHWMRYRLRHAGVRPISNVVDASNYAMVELGHPTHAFDLDRLGETVIVRHAQAGERLVTLDGVERELTSDDIVVADGERAVALAGVMGGLDTEVGEASTRVLVEAAYWHPPSILLTSKRLSLRTEASARFERGMDPGFCAAAADRVAQLLEQIAGGATAPSIADEYPVPIDERTITLPVAEVRRVIGVDMARDEVAGLLERLTFRVTGDDPLLVTVPTRRPDLVRPVDLIEEVARLNGYDRIPDRVRTGLGGGLPVREQRLRRLRDVLNGCGYFEAMTFSFLNPGDVEVMAGDGDGPPAGVRIVNPLREEEGVLRTTLLPGLLRAAAVNIARHVEGVRLYEIGKVFLTGTGKLPEQPDRLGFVAIGGPDVFDATGLWEVVATAMRLPDAGVGQGRAPGYHPGRCATVLLGDTTIGVVGEVHPDVVSAFGMNGRVIAGEIDVDPVLMEREAWRYVPPSTYPPVIFDLAWAVAADVPARVVLAAVDAAGGDLLEERRVFDVFIGGSLAEETKSIGVRVTLRAADRTLSDEEVAPIRRRIVDAVAAASGGTLRGEA